MLACAADPTSDAMSSNPNIRKQFDAFVQAGIGQFSSASGDVEYVWEKPSASRRLRVHADGFELVCRGSSHRVRFDEVLHLENLPKLLDIHSVVATSDVHKILEFDVVMVTGRLRVDLPYLVYSAFAPFLGKLLRYRQVSGR